jgi:hypothetical protein
MLMTMDSGISALAVRLRGCALALVATLAACQAHPPANWVRGGSPLDIPRARWTRGDQVLDLMPDGRVLANGEHVFTIDRAGRIYGTDNDPIALLEADGRLVGKDDALLGKVGLRNASPPGAEVAWLSVGDKGEVMRFDPEGTPHPDGGWAGCGAALRTCTLATQVVVLAEMQRRYGPRSRTMIGIGMGTGTGMGTGVGFGMMFRP